jgi:hypothetical protein
LTTPRDVEEYSVVGYRLDNTLSEHGTVNRGVCATDENGYLKNITECKQIGRDEEGMISFPDDEGNKIFLDKDTPVSMIHVWFLSFVFRFFLKNNLMSS